MFFLIEKQQQQQQKNKNKWCHEERSLFLASMRNECWVIWARWRPPPYRK